MRNDIWTLVFLWIALQVPLGILIDDYIRVGMTAHAGTGGHRRLRHNAEL